MTLQKLDSCEVMYMKEKMICRGDLFYYDFGDNSGSVQSGERPVLVVQADDYNQNAPTPTFLQWQEVELLLKTMQ